MLSKFLSIDIALERMSDRELNRCFIPNKWNSYTSEERLGILQELENRFAAEQGRPAKEVVPQPFEGTTFGAWSKGQNVILINQSMIEHSTVNTRLGSSFLPETPYHLYNTVAHEGYHAYQSYAVEHPEIHPDKAQAEEWRLNSADAVTENGYESNYNEPEADYNRYRLQPLERDASRYGDRKARQAFDEIEAEEGYLPYYEDRYKETTRLNSYDTVLKVQMERDPQCIENMQREMQENCRRWGQLQESDLDWDEAVTYENEMAYDRPLSYEEARRMDSPYAEDVGQSVLARTLSGNTVYRPSLMEQYSERVEGLNNLYPDRFQNPASRSAYMESLYQTQEELGYFPELDPRAEANYEAMKSYYESGYADRLSEVSPQERARAEADIDAYCRDSTGYYPNRPELHEQMQVSPVEEQSEEQSEDEGFDMNAYVGNAGTISAEEQSEEQSEDEGFDMNAYAGNAGTIFAEEQSEEQSEDEGFDMNAYAGNVGTISAEEQSEDESEDEGFDMNAYAGNAGTSSSAGQSSEESEEEEHGYSMYL